jgi:hypothetical protein
MSGVETNLRYQVTQAAIAWRRGNASIETLIESVDALLALRSQQLTITKHALERYRTRSDKKDQSLDRAKGKLMAMLDRATEIELKPEYSVVQLLNHGFKDARYFRFGDWVLVVSGESVVTCYRSKSGKWR